MTLEDNLRQIEGFVEKLESLDGFLSVIENDVDRIKWNIDEQQAEPHHHFTRRNAGLYRKDIEEILKTLSSLRTLLEGDAGEVVEQAKAQILLQLETGAHYGKDIAIAAVSVLSAKAKLGEAEILKAKREVLEDLKNTLEQVASFTPHSEYQRGELAGMERFIGLVERELAALGKEAGK